MEPAPAAKRFDLFISYSRQDSAFVRRLVDALDGRQRRVWVDWEGIPPSAEWMREIRGAIEAADTFVFVASPASLGSEVCLLEVAHAADCRKRLIPLVLGEVDPAQVPQALRRLNWIACRTEADFGPALDALMQAVDTDLEWVRDHTRLLVRAVEWRDGNREPSLLLRGADLGEAERWLSQGADQEPRPTALHQAYVIASRTQETRRSRRLLAAVVAGLLLAVGLAVAAWVQRAEALSQRTLAEQRQAQAQQQAVVALTNGSNAARAAGQELDALRTAVQLGHGLQQWTSPDPLAALRGRIALMRAATDTRERQRIETGHLRGVTQVVFAADDQSLFTAGGDGRIRRWSLGGRRLADWYTEHGGEGDGCTAIRQVALSPDGQTLATLGNGGDFARWSTEGQLLDRVFIHVRGGGYCTSIVDASIDFARGVVTVQDEDATAEWSFDGERLGSVAPGAPMVQRPDPPVVRPDGAWSALPQADGTLWLQPRGVDEVHSLGRQGQPVFSHRGDRLATVAATVDDSVVHLWDLQAPPTDVPPAHARRPPPVRLDVELDGADLSLSVGFASPIRAGIVSADGRLAAVVTDIQVGTVALWALAPAPARAIATLDTRQLAGADFSDALESLAFSPDGRRLATGGTDGTVKIWDTADGSLKRQVVAHGLYARAEFSADGQWLLTRGDGRDGEAHLRLWSADGDALDDLSRQRVADGWFGPDSQPVLATTAEETPRLLAWSLDLGHLQRTACGLLALHLAGDAASAEEKAACR